MTPFDWGIPPTHELPTWCVALRPASISVDRLAALLGVGEPPVIGRPEKDYLLLDLRSVFPRQDMQIVAALEALVAPGDSLGQA